MGSIISSTVQSKPTNLSSLCISTVYIALACTILPPISPTIYFQAHSIPGVTLKRLTEVFLRSLASRRLPYGLLYLIAEDHPNIRLELSSTRVPDRRQVHEIGPTRRFCSTRRRCHFRTIRTGHGPPSRASVWRHHKYRVITSSAGQGGCRDTSRACHLDAPVATHSTVSWSQTRDVGPLIVHTRQTMGF